MDTLAPLLEDLTASIDDLETALNPLLSPAISTQASKLPLLDKAKLHVLATYALDSLLFSLLKLNGTDTKSHPVSAEISRVRSYFGKLTEAEKGPAQRTQVVDKDALGRFVRAGLAGNEQSSGKRKAEDQSGAAPKHTKFTEQGSVAVVRAEDVESSAEEGSGSRAEKKAAKRQRRLESKMAKQSPVDGVEEGSALSTGATISAKPGGRSGRDTFLTLPTGPLPKVEGKKNKKRKSRADAQEKAEDNRMKEMM